MVLTRYNFLCGSSCGTTNVESLIAWNPHNMTHELGTNGFYLFVNMYIFHYMVGEDPHNRVSPYVSSFSTFPLCGRSLSSWVIVRLNPRG